ncbi:MAG: universal stress protein [Planctomycetota bacterium]
MTGNGNSYHSIFIPSDFSDASERALAHALAMAVVWQSELCLLHAGGDAFSDEEWENAPSVRGMLAEWGFLERNATRQAIFDELRVRVRKVESRGRPPLDATLEFLRRSPTELIVLATGARRGLLRMMHRSVAEAIGRQVAVPVLYVPASSRGFIATQAGTSSLRRVTVAVQPGDDVDEAWAAVARLQPLTAGARLEAEWLRLGDDAPELRAPQFERIAWTARRACERRPLRAILESSPDLVVITAHPAPGTDASTAEDLIRRGACPVLSLPAPRQ